MLPEYKLKTNSINETYYLFNIYDTINVHLLNNDRWNNDTLIIANTFCSIDEHPLVLDIGANLGGFSIPLAKSFPNAKILAFEPLRIIYYQLCTNIMLNRLENCFAYNMAVGDMDGIIDVDELDYVSTSNIGGYTLIPERKINQTHIGYKSSKPTTKVPMITLNNLKLDQDPTFIKVDVEGYEPKLFRGAANFLEKHNFPPILFEAWSIIREDITSILKGYGYNISSILINHDDLLAQHPKSKAEYGIDWSPDNSGKAYLHRIR